MAKTTLDRLELIFTANSQQLNREITKIQAQLAQVNKQAMVAQNGIGKGLSSAFIKANIASQLIVGGFNKVLSTFKNLGSEIVMAGSAYSRITIANETLTRNLGITHEELQKLRDDLADANTYGTIAEETIRTLALSGLIKLSENIKYADARTGKFAQGVSGLVLAMKDLSAVALVDSGTGIQRLTRYIQSGRTELVEGMIEVGNITKYYQQFAQSIGKSRAELTAQEEAQVRLNIVMQEAQKVYGAYSNTYQTSGKAIASIRDVTRNILEMIGKSFEPVLRVATNALLTFFNGVRASLGQTEVGVKGFAVRVAGYLVALVRVIGYLLSKLPVIGKNFQNLANFKVKPIKVASRALNSGASGSKGIAKGLDDANKSAKKLSKTLAGFDEMNILNKTTGAGGAGEGDIGSGGLSIGGSRDAGIVDLEDTSSQINAVADNVTQNLRKIKKELDKAFKPLKMFYDKFIKPIKKPLLIVIGVITSLAIVFSVLGSVVGIVSSVFSVLGGVIGFLLSPIGLVILAIGALVGVFWYLYNNVEPVRNLVNDFIAMVKEKIPALQEAIQPVIDILKNVLVSAIEKTGNAMSWLFEKAIKPLSKTFLENLVPAISVSIDMVINIIEMLSKLVVTIYNIVAPVIGFLGKIFKTVFMFIADLVIGWYNKVIFPLFKLLFELINNVVIPVIQNLWVVFRTSFNLIKNKVIEFWNVFRNNVLNPIVNWISNKIMPKIDELKNKFIGSFNKIKDSIIGIWGSVQQGVKSGLNGMIDLINRFVRKTNLMIDGLNNKLRGKVPGWKNIGHIPTIPKLATGGYATGGTLAVVGEAGREAVLPLDKNTEWADIIAEKLQSANKNNREKVNLIVKLGEETIFEKFIDFVNDKSLLGNNVIFNL